MQQPLSPVDFDNYPLPSSKEGAAKGEAEAEEKSLAERSEEKKVKKPRIQITLAAKRSGSSHWKETKEWFSQTSR